MVVVHPVFSAATCRPPRRGECVFTGRIGNPLGRFGPCWAGQYRCRLAPTFFGPERISPMYSHLIRGVVFFLKREDGPTAVEYAVLLAPIIVLCVVAITALGSDANKA